MLKLALELPSAHRHLVSELWHRKLGIRVVISQCLSRPFNKSMVALTQLRGRFLRYALEKLVAVTLTQDFPDRK